MVSIGAAVFGVEWVNRALLFVRGRIPLQFRPKLCFQKRRFNVFWGLNAESILMMENARRSPLAGLDPRSVVFVLPETNGSWLNLSGEDNPAHELTRNGWLWILGTVERPGRLRFARRHFFLDPDGHRNVALAEALMDRLEKTSPPHEVSVYVRTWTEADDDALFRWADGWNGKLAKKKISLEIVREEAVVSRKFLVDHPMLDCPGVDIGPGDPAVAGEFKVLLLGFGIQGRRLLADMVCDAQFLGPDGQAVPLRVDVVDRDAGAFGAFRVHCPDACSRYGIDFHAWDVREEGFWTWLAGQSAYNRVVVATQDDVINLDTANALANDFALRFEGLRGKLDRVIYARVRNPDLFAALKRTPAPCTLFGNIDDTYSPSVLLNDRWNAGALFINGLWAASYEPELREAAPDKRVEWYKFHEAREGYGRNQWRRTSAFNRESSISSLLNQRNLLRLLGFDVSASPPSGDLPDSGGQRSRIMERFRGKTLAALSEMEHMRWMAFHFLRGWKAWIPTDDELRRMAAGICEANKGKKKEEGKKLEPSSLKKSAHLHADLVDFDRLARVDERFNAVNRKFGLAEVDSPAKDLAIVFGVEALLDAGFFVSRRETPPS